jgi:delta 1-pyrroline-5-carboxylate dehydrogenase
MYEWGDDDDEYYMGPLSGGTRKGEFMHNKQTSKPHPTDNKFIKINDEIKTELANMTKVMQQFAEEQQKMKKDFLNLQQKIISQLKTAKININTSSKNVNIGNKRNRSDSSSSENEDNEMMINMQQKLDKQDNVMSQLSNMILSLNKKIDTNFNNSSQASIVGGDKSFNNNKSYNNY